MVGSEEASTTKQLIGRNKLNAIANNLNNTFSIKVHQEATSVKRNITKSSMQLEPTWKMLAMKLLYQYILNEATPSTSRSPLRKDSISTDGATRTSHAKRHRNTMHENKSSVMLRAVVLHMQFITNLYVVFAHCSSVYSKLRMNPRILISPPFSSYRMHRSNTNLTKMRKQEKLIGSM